LRVVDVAPYGLASNHGKKKGRGSMADTLSSAAV